MDLMPTTFTRPVLTPAAQAGARPSSPLVSLTTDFGDRDPSPAICRGVVLSIAPDVRLLDVSHEIAKYSIADGAQLLWCVLPYLPVGVHVAVVDPGVGTPRLPVGIRVARGDLLVGPDNGLLVPVAERLGGIVAARALENPAYRLPEVSASFHGRDIFAPAGAHLALGVPLEEFGRAVDPADLVRLELPRAEVRPDALETGVTYIDTFGNVKLAGERADLEAALGTLAPGDPLLASIERREAGTGSASPGDGGSHAAGEPAGPGHAGGHAAARVGRLSFGWQTTFGSVSPGAPLLYEDSYGRLCLAVNQGDAGASFGLAPGDRLAIRRG